MCTLLDLSVMSKFLNYYCFMVLVLCYTAGKFDFYLCLCVKFHKSSLQVPIFTAEGPYFIKSWVPIGSLFLSSQDSQILVLGDKNSDWSPQMYSIYEDQTHVRSREGAEEQVKLKHALVDSHRLSEWPDCRISRAPCPTISKMPCSSIEGPSSSGVNKKPEIFIFEYWVFSQKSYLNMGCFEKFIFAYLKIQYLHT